MTTPEATSAHLARVIGDAASAAGISQRELSEKSGIPLVTLNRKINGRTPFNAVELIAAAHVLGLSLTEITLRAERAAADGAA